MILDPYTGEAGVGQSRGGRITVAVGHRAAQGSVVEPAMLPERCRVLAAMAAAFALLAAGGCKGSGGKEQPRAEGSAKQGRGGGAGPKFPVDAYPVEARRTEYTVTAPGTIDA